MVHKGGGVVVGQSFEAHGHHSGVLYRLRTYDDDDDDNHSDDHDNDLDMMYRGGRVKLAHIIVSSASTVENLLGQFLLNLGSAFCLQNMITLKKFSGLKNHLA